MQKSNVVAWVLYAGVMVVGADRVSGQNYPDKPVRIVTSGVGGAGDVVSRLLAAGLAPALGQPVVVDNRASGIIPAEIVAKAPPDGYTLMLYGNVVWLAQFMQDNMPYDAIRDFAPVTLVSISPNILVVHPSLPAKSVKELIVLAKSSPGKLNYASSGPGSSSHLAGELFKAMAGVNVVRINYKNLALAFSDVISGQVELMFATSASVTSQVKAGRLRALAVTGLQQSALWPDLPTMTASGLPGYEAGSVLSLFVPAKTPEAIVRRLNQESVRYLNTADAKARFLNVGLEIIGGTPDQLAAAMKSEMARLGKVIKDADIRAE